ncbi:MAG: IS66 family transposase zinc-finger binding domain-containing protein [Candidatus Riflebacteria bacterium]|nr:IS66 family transposase zinc-finger binding domain-containing protein [Candidatus Riflebacteria bacterium]
MITSEKLTHNSEFWKGLEKVSFYENETKVLQNEISFLKEQVKFLIATIHAQKSDRKPIVENPYQLKLPIEELQTAVEEKKGNPEIRIKEHSRKKRGRRKISDHLPRVDVVHDLSENEKTCGCCGETLSKIGNEISEKLDIVPAQIKVMRHIRYKYACKKCEGVDDPQGAVKTAPLPPQIIPQGIVSPGLLAHINYCKIS